MAYVLLRSIPVYGSCDFERERLKMRGTCSGIVAEWFFLAKRSKRRNMEKYVRS